MLRNDCLSKGNEKQHKLTNMSASNIVYTRSNITLLFVIPCIVLFNLKLKPSTSQPTHFREIFLRSSHHMNTNKGSIVKQSGNDVEGCQSEKVLFQPSKYIFLQYSVMILALVLLPFSCFSRSHLLDIGVT